MPADQIICRYANGMGNKFPFAARPFWHRNFIGPMDRRRPATPLWVRVQTRSSIQLRSVNGLTLPALDRHDQSSNLTTLDSVMDYGVMVAYADLQRAAARRRAGRSYLSPAYCG